jgi:hypothetical protein
LLPVLTGGVIGARGIKSGDNRKRGPNDIDEEKKDYAPYKEPQRASGYIVSFSETLLGGVRLYNSPCQFKSGLNRLRGLRKKDLTRREGWQTAAPAEMIVLPDGCAASFAIRHDYLRTEK